MLSKECLERGFGREEVISVFKAISSCWWEWEWWWESESVYVEMKRWLGRRGSNLPFTKFITIFSKLLNRLICYLKFIKHFELSYFSKIQLMFYIIPTNKIVMKPKLQLCFSSITSKSYAWINRLRNLYSLNSSLIFCLQALFRSVSRTLALNI